MRAFSKTTIFLLVALIGGVASQQNAPTSIECFNFGCRLMNFMNWSASAATPSNTINVEMMSNDPHQLSDKVRDEILSSIISQRKKRDTIIDTISEITFSLGIFCVGLFCWRRVMRR
jgi:hypothetical protein